MAKRRMFSTDIIDDDRFLDMPSSTRCLYYDLGMRADDDGFISPRKVLRLTGATTDDLNVLIAKGYIIPFESGVIVIKDWKMNNYIQKDRYIETVFKKEKRLLLEDGNKSYVLENKARIQNVYKLDTQVRLGKVSKDKSNIIADKPQSPYKRLEKEKQQPIHRIIYHLEDTLNTKIVNWGKQAKALKMMLSAGYTEDQIKKVITYMVTSDDFFSDKGFDLMTVANNISRYKAQGL